jgi:hypothetical protein
MTAGTRASSYFRTPTDGGHTCGWSRRPLESQTVLGDEGATTSVRWTAATRASNHTHAFAVYDPG